MIDELHLQGMSVSEVAKMYKSIAELAQVRIGG